MARRRYALERGGPKRLELRWRRGLRDFEVELDGQVWSVDRTAVVAGTSITLPGGSSLFVHWVKRQWSSIALRDTLRVDRDGVPVPGSDEDPRVVGRRAASVVALFGFLRLFLAVSFAVFARPAGPGSSDAPSVLPAVLGLESLVLLGLAVAAALGARPAVIVAAVLLALELGAGLAMSGGRPSPLGVVIQVLVVVHLYRSWQRMKPRLPTANLAAVFE